MISNFNLLGSNTSHRTNLMSLLEKTLAENGTFVMKMPSLKKKKEVCKRHINSYSYQSKKRGNPESNHDYKVDKVEDESI